MNGCRPFQGSIHPKTVYKQSVQKPVPAYSSEQLWRRHQSYGSCYCQSKFDSQVKRKDSSTHAAAPEPSDVTNAKEVEEKLAPNEANTYYNVQSLQGQDSAVKAWLIDPYT